jgi:hypothetical protein
MTHEDYEVYEPAPTALEVIYVWASIIAMLVVFCGFWIIGFIEALRIFLHRWAL